MQSWFVEDNFGQQWRISLEPLEPPVGTTLLWREPAEVVVFRLVYFSMGGGSASRARVVTVLCAIGEAVCMRVGALPRGPEAVRVALGEEGLDEQLRLREAIASSLEAAVAYGRLHVYSVAEPQFASDWSPPVSARHDQPLALVSESSLTWFEVRVVDTFGAPIAGVELVLSRGAVRQTTNGSGTARWSGVEGESSIATARVERLSDLRQRLLPEPLTLVLDNPMRPRRRGGRRSRLRRVTFFHHGMSYANEIWDQNQVGAARGMADIMAIGRKEHIFPPPLTPTVSWALFYWRLRFGGTQNNPVERVQVPNLAAAVSL